MQTVLRSSPNNIQTDKGNQLTLFINLEGVLTIMDYRGVMQPISDYISSSPSFDQVEEFPTRADFPSTGVLDVIYVALDTSIPYIWNNVTSDYDVLDSNTGIGGIGTATYLPVFTGPNTIGNSKWTDNGTFTKYTNHYGQYVSILSNASNILRLDRGQSFMNFSLGNPANSSYSYFNSSNTVGLKLISNGIFSFNYGVPNVSETEVLTIDHDIVSVKGLFEATIGTDDGADNFSKFSTTDIGFNFVGVSGFNFDNSGQIRIYCNPDEGFVSIASSNDGNFSSTIVNTPTNIDLLVNTTDANSFVSNKVIDNTSGSSSEARLTSTAFSVKASAYDDGGFFEVFANIGNAYIGDYNGNQNSTYMNVTDTTQKIEFSAGNVYLSQGSFNFANLTTAQINAQVSPVFGEIFYNTTLNTICFYNGASWQQVSTTAM